jgi:hypothetical protein
MSGQESAARQRRIWYVGLLAVNAPFRKKYRHPEINSLPVKEFRVIVRYSIKDQDLKVRYGDGCGMVIRAPIFTCLTVAVVRDNAFRSRCTPDK